MADYFEELGWTPTSGPAEEREDEWQSMAQFLLESEWYPEDLLGDWPRPIPPAAKSAVENLPEFKVEDTSKECTICLKEFEYEEVVKKMPCQHIFHKTCIVTWLENNNSCPCCRHELPTDDAFYESFKKLKVKLEERMNRISGLHNSMFT